jgi:hypothetical protein
MMDACRIVCEGFMIMSSVIFKVGGLGFRDYDFECGNRGLR